MICALIIHPFCKFAVRNIICSSMKQLVALLVWLILGAWSLPVCAQNPWDGLEFRQFSTPEGLPNSMVHQVYQDRDGFIWISTFYGLFRYDGYEVRTYKSNLYSPNLLPSNNVLCTAEDGSHRLWIGTSEGLCMLHKPTGHIQRIKAAGIDKQRVNYILATRSGEVFVGYIRGLAWYDSAQDTLILLTQHNSCGDIPKKVNLQALCEDENGDLLIGTWKKGLYRYAVREKRFFHYPPLDEENSVLSLFRDSRGVTWIGTNGGGLYKVRFSSDKKSLTYEQYRYNASVSSSLPSDYIYSIHEDLQTRSLWIGTRNGLGIMPLDREGVFVHYNESDPIHYLPVREIRTVLRDRSGLMWLGTKGAGVFHVDTRPHLFSLVYPSTHDTRFNDLVSTVYVEENGAMWVGRGYGVDFCTPQGKRSPLIPSCRPYHISGSPSTGNVLLAVHDEGIIECRDGKILRQYKTTNCGFVPHDLVHMVYEDRKGNWWVCSYKGLGVRYHDGREVCFGQLKGSNASLSQELTAVAEDNDGSLWLATASQGILHLTGDMERPESLQCHSYNISNGRLPVNTPLCFHLDRSGRIWAGTEGSGLCLYDMQKDRFRSVHREYNLPGDMVGSIEEDNRGHLWLGTNQGLACLNITGKENGHTHTFTVADGLPDNFFNQNASCHSHGMFYFGCSRGVVAFKGDVAARKPSNISLCITSILIDGTPLEQLPTQKQKEVSAFTPNFTRKLVIPSAYSNFTIGFASLTYNRPQQNRYAYRLDGFDSEWHYTNAADRKAYYSKLPAGTYTFELKASNENGDWSSVRSMKIVVKPPFWITWQAYLIYILLAVLALLLVWWDVRRRILLRNRQHLQEGETNQVQQLKLQFVATVPSDDEKFLQDAIACVNRHLGDADFDVPQFVDEMATSRTTLHKKLKSLTGQNTTGFVRSIRLKAACRILSENHNIRISELAYQVGFNDPKYFSICFKKEFGVQPSEYAQK